MEQIKREMIDTIAGMTIENYEECKNKIDNYFKYIEVSKTLWGQIRSFDNPILEVMDTTIENHESNEIVETIEDVFPLQRKLKGGIIETGKNNTEFISEAIIRSKNLCHGDMIKIEKTEHGVIDFIKVRESTNEAESDREEVDFCKLVKTTEGLLVAKEYIKDGVMRLIKVEEEIPFEFRIRDEEIHHLKLEEGSIVTIAYSRANPNYHRVAWVHYNFSEEITPPTPKLSSFYKEKGEEKEHWNPNEIGITKGKEIVIVGADFRIKDFIPLANAGQFKIHSLNGNESKSRFKAKIKNKSLVISAGDHSSHRGSELAKELVKKYNIPFRASPTSLSSIKKSILHGLVHPDIAFHSFF